MSPINQYPASSSGGSETGKVVYQSGTLAQRPSSPAAGTTFFNTTTGELEIFQTGVWSTLQLPVLSKAPTITGIVDNGTQTAYGNSSVTLTYTLNDKGGYSGNYTATSSPNNISQTSLVTDPSTSNTITVSGLPSNINYTFNLAGNNNAGTGAATTSTSILATSVPQSIQVFTPTNVEATSQTITLTPGNNGGYPVTTYTLKNNNTNASINQSSPVFNLTGLSPATVYTFTATATNSNGTSVPVTSGAMPTLFPYRLLATITSSQTFTVPSNITRLAVAAIGPGNNGTSGADAPGSGGSGGAGVIFWGQETAAGTQYSVTIPSGSGGSTTFGSLLSVGAGTSYTCTATNFTAINGATTQGANGTSTLFPSNITSISGAELSGVGSGGAGGAGGVKGGVVVSGPYRAGNNRYGYYNYYYTYYANASGQAGGSGGGYGAGAGGKGGNGSVGGQVGAVGGSPRYGYYYYYYYAQQSYAQAGTSGSNYGGGGGGAGGNINAAATNGGSGGQGVVYVYGY
jgi:hypothetical protein